jgi:hypothetical protein
LNITCWDYVKLVPVVSLNLAQKAAIFAVKEVFSQLSSLNFLSQNPTNLGLLKILIKMMENLFQSSRIMIGHNMRLYELASGTHQVGTGEQHFVYSPQ